MQRIKKIVILLQVVYYKYPSFTVNMNVYHTLKFPSIKYYYLLIPCFWTFTLLTASFFDHIYKYLYVNIHIYIYERKSDTFTNNYIFPKF